MKTQIKSVGLLGVRLLTVSIFIFMAAAHPAMAMPSVPGRGEEHVANRPAGLLVGWGYRRPVTITNSGGALANYQVRVTLDNSFSWALAKSDGSDVRFTSDDGTTLIPFWIENWSPSTSANIWVKVPTIAAAGTTTIYLYYGNATATSASDGTATFLFFDDNWPQFTGSGSNPVQTATQSWWESSTSYPVVFEDTTFLPSRPRYHMLYDGHGVLPGSHAKGYAYSSDLKAWTEYNAGAPHPPNANPIMGPGAYFGGANFAWGDVIKVGSTYYLYPSQGPGTTVRMESTNLENWSNLQSLVVTGDAGGIGTGAAILKQGDGITPITVDNKYWMIYFHGFSPGTMYLAYSDAVAGDLLHWTSVGVLLSPTPLGWDADGLWTPSFARLNDKYYIYYQGTGPTLGWVTGFASAPAFDVSNNPIRPDPPNTTWTKNATPSLTHGSGWDSSYCIDPMIRQFSDGVYYLFYTGNSANGYATAGSPEGPWTKLAPPTGGWTTIGSPTVSSGILSLTSGNGIVSTTTFQYRAVGYRANFPSSPSLVWGGFINGSTGDRTMIGTKSGDANLYLKNYVSGEDTVSLAGSWLGGFHVYEVLWRAGNSIGIVDHGATSSLATQVPTGLLPITLYNYNTSNNFQVDWIFVRQYRDPEPTVALGSETPTAVTVSAFTARATADPFGYLIVLGFAVFGLASAYLINKRAQT